MLIIPAIDLLGGTCVRLIKGEYGTAHKVAADPIETVKYFVSCGAELIHIVDLDGAKEGNKVNHLLICDIVSNSDVPIELGGGIRDMEAIDYYIKNGVSRIILGSVALKNPFLVKEAVEKHGDAISVGIDAKHGYVKAEGWLETSEVYFTELAVAMEAVGVSNIIFTDIEKDGTLAGPPIEYLRELKQKLKPITKITASGGIKDLNDIRKLKELSLYGAICGKSIYSGSLQLDKAIEISK